LKQNSNIQADLFSQSTGESLAIAGMTLAKESADQKVKGWSKHVWQLFLVWLRRRPRFSEFMMEDFVKYLEGYDLIEEPFTNRAYGFISRRANKDGYIGHAGFAKVKDKKSHSRPGNVWYKK
jgi:hypothetical protein